MNGIVGLKPTRGLVGTSGVVPACRSLDCVAVFARDVADAAARARGARRAGPGRPVVARPPPRRERPRPALRLGDLADGPRLRRRHRHGRRVRRGRRARRRPRRRRPCTSPVEPLFEAGDLLYTGPWVAERLAGLERVPRRRTPTTSCRSPARSSRRGRRLRRRRRLPRPPPAAGAARRSATGVASADVLLLPTVADDVHPRPARRRSRWPATSCSAATRSSPTCSTSPPSPSRPGTTADGRPVGVTLLGPAFAEDRLFAAAHELITPLMNCRGGRMTVEAPSAPTRTKARIGPVAANPYPWPYDGIVDAANGRAGLHRLAGRLLRPRRLRRHDGLRHRAHPRRAARPPRRCSPTPGRPACS